MTKSNLELKLETFSNKRFEHGSCSFIEELKLFVGKEKVLYSNMNLLTPSNNIFTAFCWIPADFEDKVLSTLQNLKRKKSTVVGAEITRLRERPSHLEPPTFYRLNEFTAPFQQIVDTYGIPRYREVNPALFAIAMFPFLFGVMFGDIGHGAVLLLFGLYLCYCNDRLKEEKSPLVPLLELRYLLTMMGGFAFYAGWIYNDFVSLPINLFGSCWHNVHGTTSTVPKEDCVYPFGIDPKWYIASNELNFFNSLKMKMAVIIGVLHMSLGILLKGINAI